MDPSDTAVARRRRWYRPVGVRRRDGHVTLPVTILAVDEHHRPLNDAGGRVEGPMGRQAVIDAVGRLQDIGVTWTSVPTPPARSLADHLEGLHWVAEEIMPAFR